MTTFCSFEPFPKQALVFMCLQYKSFVNTVGKGEIARIKQFLLFQQCFLSVSRTSCHFHQIGNCRLQILSVWKSLCRLSGKGLSQSSYKNNKYLRIIYLIEAILEAAEVGLDPDFDSCSATTFGKDPWPADLILILPVADSTDILDDVLLAVDGLVNGR